MVQWSWPEVWQSLKALSSARLTAVSFLEFQMAFETLAALKWPFVFQQAIQFCDQLDNLRIFPSEIGPCHYLAALQADDFLSFFFRLGAVQWYWTSGSAVWGNLFFFLHFEICFNDTVSDLAASSSWCRLQLTKHPFKARLCKNRCCAILPPQSSLSMLPMPLSASPTLLLPFQRENNFDPHYTSIMFI